MAALDTRFSDSFSDIVALVAATLSKAEQLITPGVAEHTTGLSPAAPRKADSPSEAAPMVKPGAVAHLRSLFERQEAGRVSQPDVNCHSWPVLPAFPIHAADGVTGNAVDSDAAAWKLESRH